MSTILLCGIMILGLMGCGNSSKVLGDEIWQFPPERIFSITNGNKDCVPIQLVVYEGGKYELFTEYETCGPFQDCNLMLKYSKSIKGTYTYDVSKVIENSVDADSKSYSMDNLPEYDIYDKNSHHFTVEKGQINRYFEKFLKEIHVNLKECASPYYIN